MNDKILEILVIECDDPKGFFYSLKQTYNILVNGNRPKDTFDSSWYFSEDEIKSVQKIIPGVLVDVSYKIKDASLVSDKIPEILTADEVFLNGKLACDVYGTPSLDDWNPKYLHLASLYEYVPVYSEQVLEDIPFVCKLIVKAESIKDVSKRTHQYSYHIKAESLTGMLFPPIYNKTNSKIYLDATGLYSIIREEVNTRIDRRYASVQSDHDFVFRVFKRVKLHEPNIKKKEVLNAHGKSYKTKRYDTRTITHSTSFCVLEICPKSYNEYQVINGIWAENEEDLWNKVDKIVNNIIEIVNKPVEECPHCKGTGVIGSHSNIDVNALIKNVGGHHD